MKIKILTLMILISGQVGAQQLTEKRTYYDFIGSKINEVYHVIAGTPTKHGEYVQYDPEGNLLVRANFKNNKLHGTYIINHSVFNISTGILK